MMASGKISFDFEFDPGESPVQSLFDRRPRQECLLITTTGDFVRFTTRMKTGTWTEYLEREESEASVDLEDIEVLERGNLYDRCESD